MSRLKAELTRDWIFQWRQVGLSRKLDMAYSDGHVEKDVDRWTYWRLLEGEVYLPEGTDFRTANGKDSPVLKVVLTAKAGDEGFPTYNMGLLLALLRWRAQQDPLAFLDAHLTPHPEAPVATIVVNHTAQIRGVDAELRLRGVWCTAH